MLHGGSLQGTCTVSMSLQKLTKAVGWGACRKEHEALALQVARARAMREGFAEDLTTMAGHAADVRAAREAAENALATARKQYDSSRGDWRRKLQDRRKKVCALA